METNTKRGRRKGIYNTITLQKVEKLKYLYEKHSREWGRITDSRGTEVWKFKGGLDVFDLVLDIDDSITLFEKDLEEIAREKMICRKYGTR